MNGEETTGLAFKHPEQFLYTGYLINQNKENKNVPKSNLDKPGRGHLPVTHAPSAAAVHAPSTTFDRTQRVQVPLW